MGSGSHLVIKMLEHYECDGKRFFKVGFRKILEVNGIQFGFMSDCYYQTNAGIVDIERKEIAVDLAKKYD